MKRVVAASIFVLLSVFIACNGDSTSQTNRNEFGPVSKNININWADSTYWDDGKAEVAIYDAIRTVYEKERRFEYTYITVSEDFNKEFRVKTDDYSRKDLYKVMKVNAFARIETDNYPYHFLTSLFLMRNNPLLIDKMTTSSQEWCGNTFKEFLSQNGKLHMHFHSYWDGEGDGELMFPAGTLLEDQLIYTLRSLNFRQGLLFNATVLATQISNKVGKPEYYKADFAVSLQDTTWKVTVKLSPEKTNEYFFDKRYPNVLVKQTTWDNRNLTLKKISRYAYWR